MAAELQLQSAHRGTAGAPAQIEEVTALRFMRADRNEVGMEAPLIQPAWMGVTYSYEKWLRLYCWAPPPQKLTNLRIHRVSGGPLPGVSQLYGERSQAEGYQPPIEEARYATQPIPGVATPLTKDAGDYTSGNSQVGPWIILQWAIEGDKVGIGPQGPVTYRISIDEY